MQKLLIILCFFILNANAFGQTEIHVRMFIQATRDSINFEPVEDVRMSRSFPASYDEFLYFNNVDSNEYWIYSADTSIFKSRVHLYHPDYTFPVLRLIDFPYTIQNNFINFTITGIPKAKPVRHFIKIPAATSKSSAEANITLRYLAAETTDSVILINKRGKHLASFFSSEESSIHTLPNFHPKDPYFYYRIVNLSHPDTVNVNRWNWMHVIPQLELNPVKRANSEVETLKEHFIYLGKMKMKHEAEVEELEIEISQLKDSISDILNPKQEDWIRGGPINVPGYGIIDGVYIPDDSLRRDPTRDASFEQAIIQLIQNEHPEKTGTILLEVKIDRFGSAKATLLSHSEEFEFIEQLTLIHLENFEWKPTMFRNNALETTHLFELVISEK